MSTKNFGLAVGACVLVLGVLPAVRADHKGKIPWVESVEQGMETARQTGRPIMLFFTADW